MRQFLVLGIAILSSGLLFASAMPPGDVQVFGWVCFGPLLLALRSCRFIVACLAPMATMMFAAWLTTTGWLYAWPKLEGEDAWHYAGFLLFGFVLVPGFVAASKQSKSSGWILLLVAATFVFGEWMLLLYLPGHLALTQYRSPAMLYLASMGGIWTVSLGLWWVQLLLAFRAADWLRNPLQARRFAAMGALLVMLCIALYEHSEPRSVEIPKGTPTVGETRLAVLQYIDADFDVMSKWTKDAGHAGTRLVVWPELSAAGIAGGGRTGKLIDLSRNIGSVAFVTTFSDDARPLPHNAASVFWEGKESERYFKRKPFGGESSQHQAGSESKVVEAAGIGIGLLVCFDSCYPDVVGGPGLESATKVIALPCMGPESPYGVVQAIHGAFTPFRSAESGVIIARSETSAFAMVTDASGRIVAQAPPGFQGVLFADLPLQKNFPLAALFAPLLLAGYVVAPPIWAIFSIGAHFRAKRTSST